MITRYSGFPNPEYQIRTYRSHFGRSDLAIGFSPAITIAASFVSKIASGEGPLSAEAKPACWPIAGAEKASMRALQNVSRLMHIGRQEPRGGHILGVSVR